MNEFQHTLKQPAELKGIGLHTGQSVKVRICPSNANTGIVFHRVDLKAMSESQMLTMFHPLSVARH